MNSSTLVAPNTSIVMSFFFFSSRRRHTRFDCDWSSDVCSSDLDDGSCVCIAGLLPKRQRDFGRADHAADERLPWSSDRKSTRLNSSHSQISYAVFCLKKKTTQGDT